MNSIKIYILLGLSFCFFSCASDNLTESEIQNSLVVEAFLYSGEKVNSIHLTKTIGLGSEDTLAPPVNDAQVFLIKNGNRFLLMNDTTRSGYYVYNNPDLSVVSGDIFNLEIIYGSEITTASTSVPPKPMDISISKSTLNISQDIGFPGDPTQEDTTAITVNWNNPDSSLYYVVLENLETDPEEISTGGTGFPPRDFNRRMTFPPTATSEFVIARRNVTYYGEHIAIIYKVNQEYADLYESRNQDSRNLNEPLTNIKNGLGVFSAFASDSVSFKVIKE